MTENESRWRGCGGTMAAADAAAGLADRSYILPVEAAREAYRETRERLAKAEAAGKAEMATGGPSGGETAPGAPGPAGGADGNGTGTAGPEGDWTPEPCVGSAAAVTNAFLDLANRDGKNPGPIHVSKLVYFAHGWHLALYGRGLIRESVAARPYGPVVPEVWRGLAASRNAHPSRTLDDGGWRAKTKLSIEEDGRKPPPPGGGFRGWLKRVAWEWRRPVSPRIVAESAEIAGETGPRTADQVRKLIERVWEVYGDWSGERTAAETLRPGSPWDVTIREQPHKSEVTIPDRLIREHFRKLGKKIGLLPGEPEAEADGGN